VAGSTVTSESNPALPHLEGPRQIDLDRCVHCGLCLNACPTYRELGVEMDSPRGRIYQMVQVANGAPQSASYVEHIQLCLACRSCETACPSGVQYGRLIEAAKTELEATIKRGWVVRTVRRFIFQKLLQSPGLMTAVGVLIWGYQATGLQRLVRASGLLKLLGRLASIEALTPAAEPPFFFSNVGKTFPAEGERRYRVGMLAGCIANVSFARLNEATVRVLQKNGCDVVLPKGQGCCGALHIHSGEKEEGRKLARRNIDAFLGQKFDAIVTNTAGCGSTLKEYHELLEHDPNYAERAKQFVSLMRDINEFLASIDLNQNLGPLPLSVTYQDSCHLLHGQKIRVAPRKLMGQVPELKLRELPFSDICCGSAGTYNIVENEMAMALLETKMRNVNSTGAEVIATANPGCMLQLRAGVRLFGKGQRVTHVVELLDESYSNYPRGESSRAS